MAVFPKRITLKNSSDTEAAIRTAIGSGGSDEILPGEVVIGTETGNVRFYTRDDAGSIISLGESGASAFSQCLVSGTEPTTLPDGSSLVEGSMWFNSTTDTFSVYYSGAWVEVSGGGGGGIEEAPVDGTPYVRQDAGWVSGGGGIENVVEDTSPQLGGDLDVNGHDITSTASVEFSPANGEAVVRGGTESGKLTLNCTANSHGVSIQSPPHASAATYTLVLPDDTGVSGQVLSTDGSGLLSWADNSGGGGGAVDSVNGETGVVSLGIQDMNDFELSSAAGLADATAEWEYRTPYTANMCSPTGKAQSNSFFQVAQTDRNGVYLGNDFDSITVGSVLWFQLDGGAVEQITLTSAASDDTYCRFYFQPKPAGTDSLTADAVVRMWTFDPTPATTVPLADGDILQWNDTDGKFKPAQLSPGGIEEAPTDGQQYARQNSGWSVVSSSGGGAVDSVNGETGVVSLGVQDMDDYEALPASPVLWDTTDPQNTPTNPGEWGAGNNTYTAFNPVSADGADNTAIFAALSNGDQILMSWTDGSGTPQSELATVSNVTTSSNYYRIEHDFASTIWSGLAAGPITLNGSGFGAGTAPLADGDILQWNDSLQKFQPASAVDSVNGETGAVSLGIQDMDDYEALPANPATWTVEDSTPVNPGEYSVSHNTRTTFNVVDSNGVDHSATFAALSAGDQITISYTDTNGDPQSVLATLSSVSPDGSVQYRLVHDYDAILWSDSDRGTIELSGSGFGEGSAPLLDGEILQWNSSLQKFRPATSSASRATRSVATSAIAAGTGENVTVSGTGKAGQLLAIETDQAAWVAIYASQAARTADAARLEDASPDAGSGVIAEVITTGAQRILVTPCINFFNDEATPVSELYLKVVNKSGTSQTITTTLTVVPTEA